MEKNLDQSPNPNVTDHDVLSILVLMQNLRHLRIAENFGSEVIRRFVLQTVARNQLGGFRVTRCLRSPIPIARSIDVMVSQDQARSYFTNLMVCNSVWVCPVCAAKITEQRRKELTLGVDNWLKLGGKVALVTMTAKHSIEDSLDEILGTMKEARRKLKSGKNYQTVKKIFGIVGSVTACEITWGKNGWHPHFHELLFIDPRAPKRSFSKVSMERRFRIDWLESLQSVGLDAIEEIGLTIEFSNSKIAQYVTKLGTQDELQHEWTVAHEVTKFPAKKAKGRQHITPQGLLALRYDGNAKAGDLFQEYAVATKGRAQLFWTRGLADLLGVNVIDDDEMVIEGEEQDQLLAQISLHDWRVIMAHEGITSPRAKILEIAKSGYHNLSVYLLDEFGLVL